MRRVGINGRIFWYFFNIFKLSITTHCNLRSRCYEYIRVLLNPNIFGKKGVFCAFSGFWSQFRTLECSFSSLATPKTYEEEKKTFSNELKIGMGSFCNLNFNILPEEQLWSTFFLWTTLVYVGIFFYQLSRGIWKRSHNFQLAQGKVQNNTIL